MSPELITSNVERVVCEQLALERWIPGDTFESVGADSFDRLEIVMAIEEEFDIEIPDEEAEKITSPLLAVEYVKARLR